MDGENQVPQIVTEDDFVAVAIERPIAAINDLDAWRMASAYFTAVRAALDAGHEQEARVFQLLALCCDMALHPEDRGNVWGARNALGTYRRTVPDDLKGEQSNILGSRLASVEHPVLRARLADIVWTNNRRATDASTLAIEAYCECVEKALAGELKTGMEDQRAICMSVSELAQRALQIAYATTSKKKPLPDRPLATFRAVYDTAKATEAFVVFVHVAQQALYYELADTAAVAADAEALASAGAASAYPMAVRPVWDLAAQLYGNLNQPDARRRCQIGALEQILAMRGQVSTAGAEASWVMTALQAIQHIEDMDEREEELLRELRRLQRKSLREMATFSVPMDIGDERARLVEAFNALDLPSALFQYAQVTRSRPVEELRSGALSTLEQSPLFGMMGTLHLDHEGKFATTTSGSSGNEEPSEDWFRHQIDRIEDGRRQRDVAAAIVPLRYAINEKYGVQERHFMPIVERSPFIPAGQEAILALGFTRFFQGDFMSAAHLLIPQLEPCMRQILKVHGQDPAKRFSRDATEEDLDLGNMLTRKRVELEQIFGVALLAEIEALFHTRPGPALRHEMAHGQVSAGACFHHNVIYACWMIYRLCCAFILRDWPTIITPAISEAL